MLVRGTPMARSEHVTELLDAAARGEAGAEAALLERVYGELQRLAGGLIAREAPGCSLQATILVHDPPDAVEVPMLAARA